MSCTCLLVYLDGRLVAADPNDFTDKLVMAYFHLSHGLVENALSGSVGNPYQLIHGNASHIFSDNDRTETIMSAGTVWDSGGQGHDGWRYGP